MFRPLPLFFLPSQCLYIFVGAVAYPAFLEPFPEDRPYVPAFPSTSPLRLGSSHHNKDPFFYPVRVSVARISQYMVELI